MHELKHDGWRIIARKSGARVRFWTRHGKEQSASFVAIANALRFLPVTACVLDGEAVTHTADGWSGFYGLRSWPVPLGPCCSPSTSPSLMASVACAGDR